MCVRPMTSKGNIIPCGKCFECKKLDRVSWSIRVQDEMKNGTVLTLTYAPEHYPGKLVKNHLINYVKRVREELRKNDITNLKYFGVGEYGDQFGRAHYHIIFNKPNADIMQKNWTFGHVHIDNVSDKAVHYCTKYIQKNSGYKKDEPRPDAFINYTDKNGNPKRKRIHNGRPFRIMSKGIGKEWLKNANHYKINRITYRVVDGKKYPLPRYYRDALFKAKFIKSIDKITGEITLKQIQNEISIADIQEKNKLNKLKKLVDLYGNLLKSETESAYRKHFDKYTKMYETLKFLKGETTL